MDNRTRREIAARNRLLQHERGRSKVDPRDSSRHEIALLAPEGCVGAELGVDTGQFSERLWNTNHFSSFHSVDKWDDHAHSEIQYWAVCEKLMPYKEIRVWRMPAQMFSTMIPDQSLGFVFMDCYAHTGQDDGGVLEAMWPKMQDGGVFAGDDYDAKTFPLTYAAANKFAERVGRELHVFTQHLENDRPKYDGFAGWYVFK